MTMTSDRARALTRTIMRHYGYTEEQIEKAEQMPHAHVCEDETCFDERGESLHPDFDELCRTASLVVDVILPWVGGEGVTK